MHSLSVETCSILQKHNFAMFKELVIILLFQWSVFYYINIMLLCKSLKSLITKKKEFLFHVVVCLIFLMFISAVGYLSCLIVMFKMINYAPCLFYLLIVISILIYFVIAGTKILLKY